MAEPDLFVANTTGFVHLGKKADGNDVRIVQGVTRVHRSHPLYKAAPALFDPMEVDYGVEDATAEPGKKRRR